MPGSLVLVVHVLRPIDVSAVRTAARAAGARADDCIEIDLHREWQQCAGTNQGDIARLQLLLRQHMRVRLEAYPLHVASTVFVATIAPQTLQLEIGHQLHQAGYRVRALEHQRDIGTWSWPSESATCIVESRWLPGPLRAPIAFSGTVVIGVEVSGRLNVNELSASLGHQIEHAVIISIDRPGRGAIQSEADAQAVAAAWRDAFTTIREKLPNHRQLAGFLAVPPAVAVLLGAGLQENFGRHLVVFESISAAGGPVSYQAGGVFLPVIPASSPPTSDVPRMAQAIDGLRRAATDVASWYESGTFSWSTYGWMAVGVDLVEAGFGGRAWKQLERLHSDLLRALRIEHVPELAEFRWVAGEPLQLGSILAAALAAEFVKEEVAASPSRGDLYMRLFVLHEWAHFAQDLDDRHAAAVGQSPRALEELDWIADTFALVQVLRSSPAETLIDTLLETIRTMLHGLVAFQPPSSDPEAAFMQVRRLNRHLIWLIQYHRIAAMRATRGTPQRAAEILASKPIADLSGILAYPRFERTVVNLDQAAGRPNLTLGLTVDGRWHAIGSSPQIDLPRCLRALRARNADEALLAVAGIQRDFR
jgi:hypothetical protein